VELKMTKKRVLDSRDLVDLNGLFDGRSLDDVLGDLHDMAHKYEEEIFTYDKEVKFETEYYGYDGGMELYVRVMRWETDKEYAKRSEQEKAAKEKARKARETKKAKALATALTTEQEELALYKKLQKKFG
jgi:hypothetical protein